MKKKIKMPKIMGKKIKMSNIWSYIRELSIVIVGVAVTLSASGVIVDMREQDDLKQQLDAIYLELNYNKDKTEMLVKYYQDHEKLKNLLILSLDKKNQINADTMNFYLRHVGKITQFTYKKGAYEMFVNSGAMRLMKDRKLLIEITDSYAILETTKDTHKTYLDMKTQEILRLFSTGSESIMEMSTTNNMMNIIEKPFFKPIFTFYISVSSPGYYSEQANILIGNVLSKKQPLK